MNDLLLDVDNSGLVTCYATNDDGDEVLVGAIRKNRSGQWVFHGGKKILLTCSQLKKLGNYISAMNIEWVS